MTIGNAVGAAITNHRLLGPAEAKIMVGAGLALLALAVVALVWPFWITAPLAIIGIWTALALLVRAYKLHQQREVETTGVEERVKASTARSETKEPVS